MLTGLPKLVLMKLLLLPLLLISIITNAQQKKTYLHAFGGPSYSNEATTKAIFGLSAGARFGKIFGIGLGAGFIQFEKPYIPLTVDLYLIPVVKKVSPIAGVKAGYGIFNYHPSGNTTMKGSFVGSAFAGITLSHVKMKPNITIGATRYSYKEIRPTKTKNSDDKRFFAAIGILL
jgi:hypothetical protein